MLLVEPCPFCGNKPRESTKSGDERDGYSWTMFLGCDVCDYQMSETAKKTGKLHYCDEDPEKVRKRLHKKWNKRTPS